VLGRALHGQRAGLGDVDERLRRLHSRLGRGGTGGCVAWTLGNEKPLYVATVSVSNRGAYHHSNWFVVPENRYAGPDGFFRCRDRGFDETAAAVLGTVIFAQSTQSQIEEQSFLDGAVIKIPPRHKVVAGVHLLNPSSRTFTTELRMSLGLVHPREVEVVLAPFQMTYHDLDIPPRSDLSQSGRAGMDAVAASGLSAQVAARCQKVRTLGYGAQNAAGAAVAAGYGRKRGPTSAARKGQRFRVALPVPELGTALDEGSRADRLMGGGAKQGA